MKKQLLLLLTVILSLNGYSQISFEKGYYINNAEQKIECLIENIDWNNNPTHFEYKLAENSEPLNADIKFVKEFGIYNNSKYVRKTVKIDRSSKNIDNLSSDVNPVFLEEVLFLKVLIEGKSNLYLYKKDELQRFFYNKENSNIEQLVYKKYLDSENEVRTNNLFKQQLWMDLKCPTIEMAKVEHLEYKKSSLINFFIEYNKCDNLDFINYEGKEKKDLFNLTFRMHLNNSSLSVQNSWINLTTDFGNESSLGFGVEAEYILPFNKNKWSLSVEPTFQYFKSEKTFDVSNVSGGKLIGTVDYSSIELPLSVRHYFFLNKNSKIFINASLIYDFSSKSSIEFKRANNTNYNTLEIKSGNNFGFGVGYKLKDKYSLEMRYQTSRNILGDYVYWNSNYNKLSIIFGYSMF
ncbi:hypothetical protein D3C85_848990 [compost metagenome]